MTLARKDALRRADVVVIFGTPLDFRLGYGKETHIAEDARLIQVDLDGGEIGRNRAIDVGIVGDTGLVMEQMTAVARRSGFRAGSHRAWTEEIRGIDRTRRQATQAEMESDATPINPVRACAEIDAVLDEDTIVIGDGGDFLSLIHISEPRDQRGSRMPSSA